MSTTELIMTNVLMSVFQAIIVLIFQISLLLAGRCQKRTGPEYCSGPVL